MGNGIERLKSDGRGFRRVVFEAVDAMGGCKK
jgi:hypothetical protein